MTRPSFKTIFICIGLFLAILIWRFPYRNLRTYVFDQINKTSGIRVDASDFYPVFFGWPGLTFSNVAVRAPLNRMEAISFNAKYLTVRVGLGSLIPPSPSFSLNVEGFKKGGDAYVSVTPNKTRTSGYVSVNKLILEQFDLPWFADPLTGIVNAQGSFDFQMDEFNKSKLDLILLSDRLVIPSQNLQGIVLPQVEFKKLDGKILTKDGSFVIQNLKFGTAESDLRGTIVGSLKLGSSIMNSFLNLTMNLQLSERYKNDPNSVTLVSFLSTFQTNPGEYALQWNATFEDMQKNIFLAIPKKP